MATEQRRCLFVASGETATAARQFLRWGDLITLNRSLEFFDSAYLAIVGTRRKQQEMEGQWHKVKRVLLLFPQEQYDVEIVGPKVRFSTVLQTREAKSPTGEIPAGMTPHEAAIREHIQAGNSVGRGATALAEIHKLGYTSVWLFGHDGGHSRLPGLGEVSARGYDKGRLCTEEMAKHLKLNYAFWPDRPR